MMLSMGNKEIDIEDSEQGYYIFEQLLCESWELQEELDRIIEHDTYILWEKHYEEMVTRGIS